MKNKRFNYYGRWIYNDVISLSDGTSEGDVVIITSKKGEIVHGKRTSGEDFSCHHTHFTKGGFVRQKDFCKTPPHRR